MPVPCGISRSRDGRRGRSRSPPPRARGGSGRSTRPDLARPAAAPQRLILSARARAWLPRETGPRPPRALSHPRGAARHTPGPPSVAGCAPRSPRCAEAKAEKAIPSESGESGPSFDEARLGSVLRVLGRPAQQYAVRKAMPWYMRTSPRKRARHRAWRVLRAQRRRAAGPPPACSTPNRRRRFPVRPKRQLARRGQPPLTDEGERGRKDESECT